VNNAAPAHVLGVHGGYTIVPRPLNSVLVAAAVDSGTVVVVAGGDGEGGSDAVPVGEEVGPPLEPQAVTNDKLTRVTPANERNRFTSSAISGSSSACRLARYLH
jgi:hypothetical protein